MAKSYPHPHSQLKPHENEHGHMSEHEKGVHKYGDVKFAEPEKGKFPIDTPEHIRAAESYKRFAGPEGKARIDAAARKAGIGDH